MVKTIYQPPQIADDEDLDTIVAKYMTDYRRVYVQHPRVRYDGVYIAVCHYMYVLWSSISMPFVFVEELGARRTTVATGSGRTSG